MNVIAQSKISALIRDFRHAPTGEDVLQVDHRPEMVHSAPDGKPESAFRQQIFDVAEAQREPNVEPNRVLDDFGRKAIAAMPPTAVCDRS